MNLKLALRGLIKNPFVTVVAVISLALGLGANAAMFSLFHQILLRDLPVEEPSRLVNMSASGPNPGNLSCGDIGDCDSVFSYPMFRDLEQDQTTFTGIAAHVFFRANLAYRGQTESGRGLVVSGSYFPVLGVKPALGRLFSSPADDAATGEPHAVVLSYGYWQRRFGQDSTVLNQTLIVNGQTMAIVGVAGKGFEGTTVGSAPDVFIPLTMMGLAWPGFNNFTDRTRSFAYLFARLKPGVSMAQAVSAINGPYHNIIRDVEAPLHKLSPQTLARFKAKQIQLADGRRGQSAIQEAARVPLILLIGITAFVLLIACSNIANLLLARAAARTSEIALRLSLGANRRQLITQLLVESCLLAILGGILGVLVAQWTLDLIASLVPADTTIKFQVDTPVLMFTAALTLGTGLLFGLFPALHSTRANLMSILKAQSGQPSGARSAARFRTGLATGQIALSMALLVLAGLFTKSLLNISRANLGMNTDHVVTFRISPGLNGYSNERTLALFQRVEDEMGSIPGVAGVTASTVPVLGGDNWGTAVSVQGFEGGPDVDTESRYTLIGADYFRSLGVPLLTGREFTRADTAKSPRVAIVNEQFAKKFNLGNDVVGKRIGLGNTNVLNIEIVGMVHDAKYSEVKDKIPPVFYLPYRQRSQLNAMSFYLQTSGDPNQLVRSIPSVMTRVDSTLPVEEAQTLPQQVRQNIAVDRVISVLSATFAAVATILAAIGLYGVLAYTVAQRTREIGVRMALGAAPARVRFMVLRHVALMTVIGGTIGLALAFGAGRFAESLLFQLNGHDPIIIGTSVVALLCITLAAGLVPALRASRVDPISALRYE